MIGYEYLKVLVEEMHSTTVATIGKDGYPQTRVIALRKMCRDLSGADNKEKRLIA